MFKRFDRFLVPLFLSTVPGVVLSTTGALAYDVGAASSESAPSVVTPGAPFPVSATFIQSNGVPDSGLPVVWSSTTFTTAAVPARSDRVVLVAHVSPRVLFKVCTVTFNPPTSTTNAFGVATTTGTVTPGCSGSFTLTATIPRVGSVSLTVSTATGTAAGGFPNTSSQSAANLRTGGLIATVASLLGLSLLGLWLRAHPQRPS